MPRSLTEKQYKLLRELLRNGGYTTRGIARLVECGTGTVTRMKKDLGFEIRAQTSPRVTNLLATRPVPNMKGGRPPNLDKLPKNDSPSPAAMRLATFDPIVRRAIAARPIEEDDDGE